MLALLALTTEGLEEAINIAQSCNCPLWCGNDIAKNISNQHGGDINLNIFNYSLEDANPVILHGAMEEIAEKYPQHRIWVEMGFPFEIDN